MAKMEIPANRFRHNCLGDSGQISGGLPAPVFPRWELIPELIVPALSLASVGLSVSAGISQTYLVKIRIFEVAQLADGRYEERAAPTEIPSGKTTILGVYGNAFFAAVYTLERSLPSVERTSNAAIILTMRSRDVVMSSFLAFLERYAKKVRAGGNRLILCGVEPQVRKELERSGTIKVVGEENVFATTPILGESMTASQATADEWLKKTR